MAVVPQPQAPAPASQVQGPRVVSDEDKALSRELQKVIEDALRDREDDFKRFTDNRKLLRGLIPGTDKKLRTNLHFANLAAMRPQVYAKDPEFSVQPSKGVPLDRLEAIAAFGDTSEALLDEMLVRRCQLKRRAKRILTSAYTNAVGWWKLSWQQGRPADPLIVNRIKDTQDNIRRLEQERQELQQEGDGSDEELAELREILAGLQSQSEQRIGRGVVLDFVMPDDMLILDRSIFEIQDYERSDRIAQCVWMTREQYENEFGYDPEKAKVYRGKPTPGSPTGAADKQQQSADKCADLIRVFEVWDQKTNRVHTVCMGDEGLARESYSPDWTGQRWFPFFLLLWNEIDGAFIPPSDVELTDAVVREYNEARADLEQDRRDARPFTLFRKGGQLTPTDVDNIRNRRGNDLIGVEGLGNAPLTNDIAAITLGNINPAVYDTEPSRADMEMLVGGGDAARGAVLRAKTATEAEIMSQGLRGRSAERTDVIEDLLSSVGSYALEVMLRKLTPQEVTQIAGADAVWPQLTTEQVFNQVSVRVRGGSTGKPDRLQEQDRWTKLLPVIKDTVKEIVAVRQAGQEQLAQLAMALLKETLRRFDERFEVEKFLPEPQDAPQDAAPAGAAPQIPPELIAQVQQQMQELQQRADDAEQKLRDKEADIVAGIRKAEADAAAKVEIAKVTAPIQAQADIEIERIKRAADAAAQMNQASLQAENEAANSQNEAALNTELQAVREQIGSIMQMNAGIAQLMQALGQPKPRMKVAHVMGPDGRIAESKLVPDEAGIEP